MNPYATIFLQLQSLISKQSLVDENIAFTALFSGDIEKSQVVVFTEVV